MRRHLLPVLHQRGTRAARGAADDHGELPVPTVSYCRAEREEAESNAVEHCVGGRGGVSVL